MIMTFKTALFALILPVALAGCRQPSLEEQADRLHRRFLTIDSHNDTPKFFTFPEYDILQDNRGACVDLPKMEAGGLDGAFFAAFVRQGPRDSAGFAAARDKALSMIGDIRRITEVYPDRFVLATTPDEAYAAKKAGKRAMFIGIENGYPVGRNLDLLEEYYRLGVRYVTLCHTRNNDLCDSANDPAGAEHDGLSALGREAVARMNALGMMVDVSHASEKTAFDAIAASKVPVIASHSCSWEVCNNRRNMSDSLLVALARNGGVMQLCILSSYVHTDDPSPQADSALRVMREHYAALGTLTPEQEQQQRADTYAIYERYPLNLATVAEAVDHIDHVVKLVGIDYVGIGTDFDGGGQLADCKTAAQLKNITVELLRRGYSDKDIEKIWGGNLMRVMRAVQDYAEKLN